MMNGLSQKLYRIWKAVQFKRLAYRARRTPRYCPGQTRLNGVAVQYVDMLSFYMEYKDIFQNGIYYFETENPNPLIIDAGSYIGMATLYFKSLYPQASVICFEPDVTVFNVLQTNIALNNLCDIELVRAGLAGQNGRGSFLPDGADGGKIAATQKGAFTIKTVPLSAYLTTPVDFLKLNIEGQELPVLQEAEASGRLSNVRQMVVEYHGWPKNRQGLGEILNLLNRNGFRYLLHDFDRETCGASKPPFRLTPQTTWFCLIYAKRIDDELV